MSNSIAIKSEVENFINKLFTTAQEAVEGWKAPAMRSDEHVKQRLRKVGKQARIRALRQRNMSATTWFRNVDIVGPAPNLVLLQQFLANARQSGTSLIRWHSESGQLFELQVHVSGQTPFWTFRISDHHQAKTLWIERQKDVRIILTLIALAGGTRE